MTFITLCLLLLVAVPLGVGVAVSHRAPVSIPEAFGAWCLGLVVLIAGASLGLILSAPFAGLAMGRG